MPFLPAHQIVAMDDAVPRYSAVFLHGILGSGLNLRSFARCLVQASPAWQILLVDHRNHGDSDHPSGPQTLNTCAADVNALCQSLKLKPRLIAGHSYGGKVALTYARNQPHSLRQVWVLDTNPGSLSLDKRPSHMVSRVLRAVETATLPLQTREGLMDHFRQHDMPEPVARWMTTNLRKEDDGFHWRFHHEAIDEMIHDYWDTDLWPFLQSPPEGLSIDLVQAELSDRWDEKAQEKIKVQAHAESVQFHMLQNAGHWVHIDNPSGLRDLMVDSFQNTQE